MHVIEKTNVVETIRIKKLQWAGMFGVVFYTHSTRIIDSIEKILLGIPREGMM